MKANKRRGDFKRRKKKREKREMKREKERQSEAEGKQNEEFAIYST